MIKGLEMATDVTALLDKAREAFLAEFPGGQQPNVAACAPGRVNLIGEHTDYNDGFVLPMALPMVTIMLGRRTGTDTCRVVTTVQEADEPRRVEFPTPASHAVLPGSSPRWANYVKGVVANFHAPNAICGFDAVIVTTVPLGGGLSSSASLEVATYTFLEALTQQPCKLLTDKALACQKAEHDFAGVPCGIMDQFISVMGKQGNALLIDCSEYPVRRRQCEEAARTIKRESLRTVTMEELTAFEKRLDATIYRRAKHVVGEIRRTEQAAIALRVADYPWLVELAMEVPGVLGSRMTGGGFGGCTVTLVYQEAVDNVIANIKAKYSGTPSFYVVTPSSGARILAL
ncbi:hypothetical protein B566_EDAN008619 [Ephemera danica]|nr:hypothetical protein B566_EDAN008619 [Ephemera danica]